MRKTLTAFLLCFCLAATLLTDVLAAETGPDWSGDALLTPGVFSIDGRYTEEGMNAPYESGYSPAAADGELTVILPLLASDRIDGDIIYCGLDLGSRENSPFLYQNYQSIPVRLKYPDPESPNYNPALYVARFVLPLSETRQNGVYPLGVDIRFRSGSRDEEQRFNIDFTVSDGSRPGGSEPGDDDPGSNEPGGSDPGYYDPGYSDPGYPDPGYADSGTGSAGGDGSGSTTQNSEPKVILQSAIAAPNPAPAGEPFTVTCTLRNTSKKQRVSNMTVSYKSQTTDLIPIGGASTQYIEEIRPDATVQFAFQMESRLDAQSGPQKIDLSLSYEGADGAAYTASDEITVQIQQSIRLEYDEPSFPTAVYIGDSLNATLNLFNKGKGTLYNVTAALIMPGIDPESSAFVGNMESGSSKSADVYASVVGLEDGSSLDEARPEEPQAGENDEAAQAADSAAVNLIADAAAEDGMGIMDGGSGESSGEFLVTYEDEFGTIGELHIPVSTEIMAMEFYDEPMDEPMEPEEESGFPWWGWALIGSGAAAAAAVPIARHRKKKRAAALAAEMDDELL
ncbi:MAG: hypothetical protein HDQ87_02130 [Clostridia bacterium]|nr:hypothetical protein [Clostridia bacterium]